MPLALEPNQTFKIVLESDKDKPESEQPYFIYRYLPGCRWRQVAGVSDQLETSKDADEVADRVYHAASIGLAGWGNMIDPEAKKHIPFDPANLDMVVGIIEAQELIKKILKQGPTREDKKKLRSPSDSSSASSAKTAQGPKNAKTRRRSSRR